MQQILPYPKDFILSNLLQFSISRFSITFITHLWHVRFHSSKWNTK